MNFVDLFAGIPNEVATMLIATLPIAELRVSIPLAIGVYKMSVLSAMFYSIVGNMLSTVFILLLLPKLHNWLIRQKFLGALLSKSLKRAKDKFNASSHKFGIELALALFVGIPLPMTGAWTGALIAFILNLPFKKSLPIIFLGVCMASVIVTMVTLGAGGVLRWLF